MNNIAIKIIYNSVKRIKKPQSCKSVYDKNNFAFSYNTFIKGVKIISNIFHLIELKKVSLGYKKGVKYIIYKNEVSK